ncbi:hypothetical protein RB653_003402 [Dictyostelium firmibasis]|uniref:Uncharacterized protein n=1 Tax=Dictyostelium firmibasis TaxID=79012 RepID=A0AAN7YRN1_9MYCE
MKKKKKKKEYIRVVYISFIFFFSFTHGGKIIKVGVGLSVLVWVCKRVVAV